MDREEALKYLQNITCRLKIQLIPTWFYGSPAAAPEKMKGWIPDALIPADALPGKGGFPINVSPLQNQGFWVDVQLPRDQKNFPPAIYSGKVQVSQMGKPVFEIPLEITLLPHYLTDENPGNVWLFTGDIYSYYPGLFAEQADEMLKFEGHRHRIDVAGGFEVNAKPFNLENIEKYNPYLDGSAFTPARGYHGNGEGVGEKLFPVGMYASPVMGNSKGEVQKQANLWVGWFKKNAPSVTYFWYITDEPREDKHQWIKERAEWIKSNPGPGKSLPIFTTTSYQKGLSAAIDIWAGYDGVPLDDLPEYEKMAETIGFIMATGQDMVQ